MDLEGEGGRRVKPSVFVYEDPPQPPRHNSAGPVPLRTKGRTYRNLKYVPLAEIVPAVQGAAVIDRSIEATSTLTAKHEARESGTSKYGPRPRTLRPGRASNRPILFV